nr:phage-related minor tail protein [uncultured Mediterranean phage uvMED]
MAGAVAPVDIDVSVKGLSEVDKLTKRMLALEKEVTRLQGKLPQAANGIRSFGRASATASGGVKALGTAIAATLAPLVSIAAVAAAAGKAINVAFERSAAEQKLRNFTSSTEEYEVALALAAQTSEKFGLSQTEALTSLADMNSRLRGLGFGLKEVSELQQGFQAIVLQSGTSAEDAAGAFLQLSQALGSGVLQGDELRSILERMPLLAQRIAESMGVSTGEIRKLGAEGKLTSDLIQKALAEAAAGSDGLGNKLSESQVAMKAFGQAADAAFGQLGESLAPAVVAAVNAATLVTQELVKWWEYLSSEVFPQVQAAIAPLQEAFANAFDSGDLQVVINLVQNGLLLAIQGATNALGLMSNILAGVINGFKALSDNPVFKFIADQVGRLADMLGLTSSKVDEFTEKQKGATDEIGKGVKNYSQMPPKIEDAKAAQKELTASLKEADTVAKNKLATLDQELQLGNARLAAEKAINGVLLEQAERKLQNAKSADEQIAAAKAIYDLTLQQAKLEYESTLAAIEGMVRKAEFQAEAVKLKYQEVQAAAELAKAQGTYNEGYEKALQAQRAAVQQAQGMLKTTEAVADEQRRAAEAVYQGAQETARAAFEQNKVWEAAEGAANAAGNFASNMSQAANQAERAAAAMSQMQAMANSIKPGPMAQGGSAVTVSGTASIEGLSEEALNAAGGLDNILDKTAGTEWWSAQYNWNEFVDKAQAAQNQLDEAASAMARATEQAELDAKALEYASAGFTQASGILSSYSRSFVDNARNSQMNSAMSTYGGSGGGSINPQVNIQTGPVTQMNGTNYVTQGDLQAATSSAAQQGANMALSQLQNNPGVRRSVGVGR